MVNKRVWIFRLMAVSLLAALLWAAPAGATGSKPGAPTGVHTTAGPLRATVSFTPGAANGAAIDSYSAACVPTAGGTSRYATAPSSPVTVTSLTAGVAYRCKVQAHNVNGWGAYSALSSSVTPTAATAKPSAPTNVAATPGPSRATVSFTPGSNNGAAIDSYSAACVPTAGGTSRYATAPSSPVTVSSMTPGVAYRCKVQAHNVNGWGAYSTLSSSVTPTAAASAKPAAPTNVHATAGPSRATVSFTPGSNNGSAVNTFSAACVPVAGGITRYAQAASSPITVPSLVPGSAYRCKVQAHNANGWGQYSALSSSVTPTGTTTLYHDTWSEADFAPWSSSWTTSKPQGAWVDNLVNTGRLAGSGDSPVARGQLTGVPARANEEVLFSYKWSANDTPDNQNYLRIALRGRGGWYDDVRPLFGYGLMISSGSPTVEVTRSFGYDNDVIASADVQQVSTAKHWVRLQVQGSTIRFRMWVDGQTEPTTWARTVTDTEIGGEGQLFVAQNANGLYTHTVYLDDLTVRALP